jgi:hypothetical protein
MAVTRGALVAAANWQVAVVQSVAESIFKLLLAVPILAGALLVALLLGRDLVDLFSGDLREMVTQVANALLARPVALVSFLFALLIVLLGGSALVFLVKGGTVTVLVDAERTAGGLERTALRWTALQRATVFSIERFTSGAAALFRRYLLLGISLMVVYALSGGLYLIALYGVYTAGEGESLGRWGLTALSSTLLVVWITLVNLLYLLTQMVIAAGGRGVAAAIREVFAFLRARLREIAGVFGFVLLLVVLAMAASIAATAALGLIAFVPLAGLAVMPLQLAALFARNLVFQYLGLTALAAYLNIYRSYSGGPVSVARPAGTREAPATEGEPRNDQL